MDLCPGAIRGKCIVRNRGNGFLFNGHATTIVIFELRIVHRTRTLKHIMSYSGDRQLRSPLLIVSNRPVSVDNKLPTLITSTIK